MRRLALAAACGALFVSPALAQTPLGTSFTYQGRLVEAGSPANGTYDFRFILYDAPSGGSQVGPIVTRDDVFVSTGLFTVGIDFGAVFTSQRRFLEVGVRPGASTGAYDVVSGRHELTAAPSALFGASAPWTGVTGKPAGFADDVDNDLLAGMVCSNGQVAKSNGASWACGADLNTTYTGGSGIQVSGTVISIPALAITNALVADNAITVSKMADNSVGSAELVDSSVTSAELASASVTTAKIATGAVGSLQIADDSITAAKIAVDAVGSTELAASAVGSAELADLAVTQAKLADLAVNSTKLGNGAVVASKIATGAVGLNHLDADSVSASKIVADAVGRSEISGTEVALYQMAGGCAQGGSPTFAFQCFTTSCGPPLFNNCTGTCISPAPVLCSNNVIGYLLSASIP